MSNGYLSSADGGRQEEVLPAPGTPDQVTLLELFPLGPERRKGSVGKVLVAKTDNVTSRARTHMVGGQS